MSNEGKKYDEGKLRWDLLPLPLVEKLVEVYTFGAQKYAPNTWQNLPDGYNRYKAAMLRHLTAYEKGESIDPDSKLNHLYHTAWNALALIHFAEKEAKQQTPSLNDDMMIAYKYYDGGARREFVAIGDKIYVFDAHFKGALMKGDVLYNAREATREECTIAKEIFEYAGKYK